MSAQDDVLAAFGEMPKRLRQKEIEASAEEVGEGALEVGGPSEGGQGPETSEPIEGSEGAEVGEQETVGEPVDTTQTAAISEAAEIGPIVEASEAAEIGEAPAVVSAPPDQPPNQPYLDPAAFFAQLQAESAPAPAPAPKRRWPGLLLRYASALVLAGAVGAGTAYAVTLPKRTDVPFLATPSDGRYTFPAMVRPEPPVGKLAPSAADNANQVHYDDLRQYLVAAPLGVTVKDDGWEPIADFESGLFGDDTSNHLYDAGLRHIARRSWVGLDGQHTTVELLQFPDKQAVSIVESLLDSVSPAKAHQQESPAPQLSVTPLGDTVFTVALRKFDQVDGLAGQKERRVVFGSGDVVAIVTTTAPDSVTDTSIEQVVSLQAEMLR